MTRAPVRSEDGGPRGPVERIRRWPLKRQLVVGLAAILLSVTVIIGAVSITIQRFTVIDRVDDQLETALGLVAASVAEDEPLPRVRARSLMIIIDDDEVTTAEVIDARSIIHRLSAAEIAHIRDRAGVSPEARSVHLGEHGEFRITSRMVGGSAGEDHEVVFGQSLDEVDQTMKDTVVIFGSVGVVGVLLAILAGRQLATWSLRSLDRVAAIASRVTRTPLATGEVVLPDRAAEADTIPGTEVGQLGAALNQMLDHVEDSIRQRSITEERLRTFLADAGHELRTPLASISGHAQLVDRRRGEFPADLARSIGRIDAESARMRGLVDDLLLLARLDAGVPVDSAPVEIARVLADACMDAEVTAPGHIWELELPDDAADLLVLGEAVRLQQVVTNLLANAGMHTPPGTRVRLGLTTRASNGHSESAPPQWVVIEVSDDGPGIPAELQDTVFDRFVRGDSSRSRTVGSTGLGLSICAAIVRAHGGRIGVRADPGGTTFTVLLPRFDSS